MSHKAYSLSQLYGGIWGEHPEWEVSDWVCEVQNNYTRLGYWDWVLNQLIIQEEE